ncbi:hypothetical protein NM208_g12005 [Fusarium decemcellulare]|uniref:Uncharacterized protein n=1 Tax=Fusarium decemcellulare TaxID=57161 RepID=A0ACC1RS96_9HYPO|nr:hypothetical protein NM208_g12005 [Fusarium decemcellulare]
MDRGGRPVFSPYGLQALCINQSRIVGENVQLTSQQENSWTYTSLASAINIGLKLLEMPQGRNALAQLGQVVVQEWHRDGAHRFGGDVRQMGRYVDCFLSAMRSQPFPQVTAADLGGPDVLAYTKRIPYVPNWSWDGNFETFIPARSVGFYFNAARVADMAAAASVMGPRNHGMSTSRRSRQESSRMSRRHKDFQFMFAVTTAHELVHVFVAYLSQNSMNLLSYTPERVAHLNYGAPHDEDNSLMRGESGRWFENFLFGGSIEFYRDRRDDHGQVGIAHILDRNGLAYQIVPEFMRRMVQDPQTVRFPFQVSGRPLTVTERRQRGLLSLGSTNTGAPLPAGIMYMRSQHIGPILSYNISDEQLRQIPEAPRRLQGQRVS